MAEKGERGRRRPLRESFRALHRDEEPEEIEYEPTSVKELLTEMKDLSELIVDLAYSAVAFDNEDIAEEVRYLENRMDTLNYRIRLTAMLAARSVEDAEQLSGILQVASAAENISNAAGDIVRLLDAVEARPALPRILERATEKIKQFTLPQKSGLANRALEDLHVESETGMRILAVRRGEKWIYAPEERTVLKSGDSLLLRGTDEGFEAFRALATGGKVA